mmetsp:Transcript_33792/g.81932  ORF Transcript_33792/g.81932 Transcript_33792/m.81932 type:complete len:81 (+) Transcript_33792:307-549(+)
MPEFPPLAIDFLRLDFPNFSSFHCENFSDAPTVFSRIQFMTPSSRTAFRERSKQAECDPAAYLYGALRAPLYTLGDLSLG